MENTQPELQVVHPFHLFGLFAIPVADLALACHRWRAAPGTTEAGSYTFLPARPLSLSWPGPGYEPRTPCAARRGSVPPIGYSKAPCGPETREPPERRSLRAASRRSGRSYGRPRPHPLRPRSPGNGGGGGISPWNKGEGSSSRAGKRQLGLTPGLENGNGGRYFAVSGRDRQVLRQERPAGWFREGVGSSRTGSRRRWCSRSPGRPRPGICSRRCRSRYRGRGL